MEFNHQFVSQQIYYFSSSLYPRWREKELNLRPVLRLLCTLSYLSIEVEIGFEPIFTEKRLLPYPLDDSTYS